MKIPTYILFPPNYEAGKRFPMVVMPHGGPHARDDASYDNFAQLLATRGYIIVQPNFRGSVGYGKKYEEAGYRQWGKLMQDDITDATNFMIRKEYADPDKICIVGGSYGGYAALMGAAKIPDLYKCAIGVNGVYDILKMVKFDLSTSGIYKEAMREYLDKTVGSLNVPADVETMHNSSPLFHAKKITASVLLVGGTDDDIVSYSQSKKMHKALKKHGKDTGLFKVKGAGHNVTYYSDHREDVYKKIVEFLAKHLGS